MSAFQELYERHYPDVLRFALFLSGDYTRAEDLAADAFVRAWVARDRLEARTVRAYLLTIVRNLYRDDMRRARPVGDLPEHIPDPGPSAEAQLQHALALGRVRDRLRLVAPGDRQALLMFTARGMSHQQIAAALGVTIGAVKSRIFRARVALVKDGDPS